MAERFTVLVGCWE